MDAFITHLQQKLSGPLPGFNAQMIMAHSTRKLYPNSVPADARKAGVLVTLFQKDNSWHILLIERRKADRDKHGGQIGFPGGKFEQDDGTIRNTALRETEEEVGIRHEHVKILGALSELYIPVSNFQVFPFVGYLEHKPFYKLQAEEVKDVLEMPVSFFLESKNKKFTDIQIGRNLVLKNVPYYDLEGKVLWGATAMILSELIFLVNGQTQD
jgi:8-oxo-dGTP pyrophosphatase MutT (NUDIX family)